MLSFTLKRLVAMVMVLLALTAILFVLQEASPVDPVRTLLGERASEKQVEAERERLGYNDPLLERYVHYVSNMAQGDLGTSVRTKDSVTSDLSDFLPASLELVIFAALIGIPVALIYAISSAARWRGAGAFRGTFFTIGSAPPFFLAIVGVIVFYKTLGWLPASGRTSITDAPVEPTGLLTVDAIVAGRFDVFIDAVKHLIMPAFCLAILPAIGVGRILRGSLYDALRSDQVRAARSRGLTDRQVIRRHCLRNSAGPTLAMTGLLLGLVFAGLTMVEVVFAWPGLGLYMVQSLPVNDFPAIAGVTLIIGAGYVIINTAVDVLQAAADPRIRD